MKFIIFKKDYVGRYKFRVNGNEEDTDQYYVENYVLVDGDYTFKEGVCYCCSDETGEVFRIKGYEGEKFDSVEDAREKISSWDCDGQRRFRRDVYDESAEGYPDSYKYKLGDISWWSDGRYEFYIEQDETIDWDDSKYNDVFEIIKSKDDKIEIVAEYLPIRAF